MSWSKHAAGIAGAAVAAILLLIGYFAVTHSSATSPQLLHSVCNAANVSAGIGHRTKELLVPWKSTEPYGEPMVSEEILNAMLMNDSFSSADVVRLVPKYVDWNVIDEARLLLKSLKSSRPAYDRVAPLSAFANIPTAQHILYPFMASPVDRSSGAGIILMRWEPFHRPSIWGKWVAHAVTDTDCRYVLAPSLIWTLFRAFDSHRYNEILQNVMKVTASMCSRVQKGQVQVDENDALIQWLPPRREYFYCLHEYTAPGDQIGLTLTCMFRLFARYPTFQQRANVSVLFPDAPEFPGLMNTISMLQRHLTEVKILLLPRNQFLALRDGDLIVPSRLPGRFPGTHEIFVKNILWPRVRQSYETALTPHRRIVLVSTGKSSTNRAYAPSSRFLAKMAKFGFAVLPPELPHDERMFHLNTADVYITSYGSTDAVNHHLGTCCNGIPKLILMHSAYDVEGKVFSWCPKQNTTCKGGRTWIHRTAAYGDDLGRIDEALVHSFVAEFSVDLSTLNSQLLPTTTRGADAAFE